MDYAGLTVRYKVNRPLTEREIEHRLLPGEPRRSKPLYHSRIIRMNSTYLECVDKFFQEKGYMSTIIIMLIGVNVLMIYLMLLLIIDNTGYLVLNLFIFLFYCGFVFIITKFLLLKECFTYTHFPIRFNRKTRKVHVFRQDGTVMTEDWDKLYFTLCKRGGFEGEWEVRGHRMGACGVTVLEIFALPFAESLYDIEDSPTWSFWEFVRRYMESPEELPALADQIKDVADVADKREEFGNGFGRIFLAPGPSAYIMSPIWIPVCFCYALAHSLAMHTSKIPQWPAEIEDECRIRPNDPYLRDAAHLAKPGPVKHA